jgi:tetratricopeptide (TPR) repeat protein
MRVCGLKRKPVLCLMMAALTAAVLVLAERPAVALSPAEIRQLQEKGQGMFREGAELAGTDPIRAADLFHKAALVFETIVREGGIENGKLFYNIGNCYLRMGDHGRAVLNYLRAERMIPGDPGLAKNLDIARSGARSASQPRRDRKASPVLISLFYGPLGFPERAWVFLGFWGLMWLCRSVYLYHDKAWLKHAFLVPAGAAALFLASLAVQTGLDSGPKTGVIVVESVAGRRGDSYAFDSAFERPLQSGTEFKLLEERSGWLHILLPGTAACWVPSSSAEIV